MGGTMKWFPRTLKKIHGVELAVALALAGGMAYMIAMPGQSHSGPLPPLNAAEAALVPELRRHVDALAGEIGERNMFRYPQMVEAAAYIERTLAGFGYAVDRQEYELDRQVFANLAVEIPGRNPAPEIVVIGAHYDSVFDSPGANDNGTGVAAVLALARRLAGYAPASTLRFVCFANEEPPAFQTAGMGSLVYARRCRAREERIAAMLSLETIGYYDDRPSSQSYPFPLSLFYPSTGNFIGFIGNTANARLVRRCVRVFRRSVRFPSEGAAVPGAVPGVGWSDHWSFWQCGYPALMVTDTAPYRYPHYHARTDTPDQVDYERLSRVVSGLESVIRDLCPPAAEAGR
jgi:hypothetical protein